MVGVDLDGVFEIYSEMRHVPPQELDFRVERFQHKPNGLLILTGLESEQTTANILELVVHGGAKVSKYAGLTNDRKSDGASRFRS